MTQPRQMPDDVFLPPKPPKVAMVDPKVHINPRSIPKPTRHISSSLMQAEDHPLPNPPARPKTYNTHKSLYTKKNTFPPISLLPTLPHLTQPSSSSSPPPPPPSPPSRPDSTNYAHYSPYYSGASGAPSPTTGPGICPPRPQNPIRLLPGPPDRVHAAWAG